MQSKSLLLVAGLGWVFALPCAACLNTSYSRAESRNITTDLLKIVAGQIESHGPAFYERELRRTARLLEETQEDFDARNDRAGADQCSGQRLSVTERCIIAFTTRVDAARMVAGVG